MGENGLDNLRGIRPSYRIIISTWFSEAGLPRVLYPTPRKKVKKEATHLKYFPDFAHLQAEVDRALLHFAQTPSEITVLMTRYCETLGAKAA